MTSLKIILAAAGALASAQPVLAQCGTPAGCNVPPTASDIIVSNSNNINNRFEPTISNTNMFAPRINTDIGVGVHNANLNTLTANGGMGGSGGALTIGQGSLSPVANGGVGYGGALNLESGAIAPVANATGGSLTNSGNSSSTSTGGNVSGVTTGNQSVNINNPRNVGTSFAPGLAGGYCVKSFSAGIGTFVTTLSGGFAATSESCMGKRFNEQGFMEAYKAGDRKVRDVFFGAILETNKPLRKAVEAARDGANFDDVLGGPTTPVKTYVVPAPQ